MKKHFLLSMCIGLMSLYASSQATLVEKVETQNGRLIIPYSRYQLPNGLTLLVSEDHSDPVTHINVTYHVGSARELPGKSGFAHFFEHMLFQGSKHVADEEHFKLIKQYGGDVNGNTTRDRTVYIETFPSNFTETALWMEADRMGCFLEAFTKKKFEVQRATVKNEKDQGQSGPYGFMQEVKEQNLFPTDHPYAWSTIGFVDDLDRVDSNDLKNFFLRWYGPNNACVIVSGDVNTAEVVKWVEKYYGSLNRCPEVRKQKVKQVVLTENKIKGFTDVNAYVPVVQTSFIGVPVGHDDEAPLDLLSYLLGGTRNSPMYKKFQDMEDPWALQASCTNNPMGGVNHELAGDFTFTLAGYPWSDMKKLQNMMQQTIDSFEWVNFNDEDLSRAKQNILSSYGSNLESVSYKASLLSTYWYLFDLKKKDGTSMNLQDDANRYANVTREDIMRVYKKYIKGKFSSTIVIDPPADDLSKDQIKALKYVSYNPNATYKNAVAEAEYLNLRYNPSTDNFDRGVKPTPGAPVAFKTPSIFRKTLANKLEILGTEFTETPMVSITMNMEGGSLLDGKTSPIGTSSFMSAMMNEGTALKTPKDLENELEKLGASISIGGGSTSTSISLYCPQDKLDAALVLLEEVMFKPRWDAKEFKKMKKDAKQNATNSLRSRGTGSRNVWRQLMWGNTAFGKSILASDMEKISLDDCKAYYNNYFVPNVTKVVVVSPFKSDEIYKKLAFLEKWGSKDIAIVKPVGFPQYGTAQIFGVNYDDAEQSDIILGFRALPYDMAGEFFKSNIMNFALGGNFNSRLNLNIREDKGWTYGIRSGYSASYKDLPGTYTVSAGIKARATDSAIKEIMTVLETYRNNGLNKEEFDFTKQAILASEALEYESQFQKSGFIMNLALRNLPEDYSQQQMTILNAITIDDLNKLAKNNLKTDQVIVVVSGDMLLLEKRLSELGYGKIQVLKADGTSKYKIIKASKKTKHDKNYK